jgi:hypothetical protein
MPVKVLKSTCRRFEIELVEGHIMAHLPLCWDSPPKYTIASGKVTESGDCHHPTRLERTML